MRCFLPFGKALTILDHRRGSRCFALAHLVELPLPMYIIGFCPDLLMTVA